MGATISASSSVRRCGGFLRMARCGHSTPKKSAPGATTKSSSPTAPTELAIVVYRSDVQLTCMSLSMTSVPSSNSLQRYDMMTVMATGV